MRLLMFRSLWGVVPSAGGHEARSTIPHLRAAAAAVKALGYDGIEVPFKMALEEDPAEFRSVLEEHDQ